jgi:hypothetical protein
MGWKHGRLIRQQEAPMDIQFSAESASLAGEPAYLELHELSTPLEEDELVVIEEPGRWMYRCRVLDRSKVCSVIEVRDLRQPGR